MDFSSGDGQPKKKELPSDPMIVSSQQEEDDLARAIQLSLQETKGGNSSSSNNKSSSSSNILYPVDSLYSGAQTALDSVAPGGSSGLGATAASVRKEEEKKAR